MSSPQSKPSKKAGSPKKRRTIYGWTQESLLEAVKSGTLPAALHDKRAFQTLDHVRSNVTAKEEKSADRLLNKRLKAYPVPDSTLEFEPEYTEEYIEKHVYRGMGAGLSQPPPICRAHGMPDDEQYGMLLQVWEFVRSFAAAALLDGSPVACGDHMVSAHAAVPTDEHAIKAAAAVLAPEEQVVAGAGDALATPLRSDGRRGGGVGAAPGSAVRSVRKLATAAPNAAVAAAAAPSEDEMLSRVNPWLVGVSADTVAKLTTSIQAVEMEDLITAFSSEAWRGHRLITRVHMALLRLLLEQMEGPQDDTRGGDDDDDEEDFLFGATAGDTGALAPTLALLSPLTWPEVLRLVLLHTPEGKDLQEMASPAAVAAVKSLKHTEYFALSLRERLDILQLLVDAAAGTKSVAETIKARLARQEAIQKKRATEEKRMNTMIKKDHEACMRRLEKRKEREAAMKEKLAAMGGVKSDSKGGGGATGGDANAALMEGATMANLRADIEKELAAAAKAKDLERLQAAMSSARESGLGFEEGRGKGKRMDAPMTAAAIALSQLRGAADKAAVEEAASFKKFRLAAKYAAKLSRVATSAELLGADRHGSKYWRFHADPTRIYVQHVKLNPERVAAAVALAQHAAVARLPSSALEPPSTGGSGAAAGGDDGDDEDGKKSRRGARFSAEAVAAELRHTAAADAVLSQVVLAAHDPQHTDSQWGFIDTVEGVEALLKSLDKRGVQERALFECLELHLKTISETLWSAAYKRQHIESTLQERGMKETCLEELVGAPVPEKSAKEGEGGPTAAAGGVKRSRQSIIEEARDAALARELADAEEEAEATGVRPKRSRRGAAVAASEKLAATSTPFARGGGSTQQSGQAELALADANTVNAEHPLDLVPAAVAQSIAVRSQLLTLCESFAKKTDPPSNWLAGGPLDTSAPVREFLEEYSAEGTKVPTESQVPAVREEHGLCAAGRAATPEEAMSVDSWKAATAAAVTGSAQGALLLALEGHMYALQRGEAASKRAQARRARLLAAEAKRGAPTNDAEGGGSGSDDDDDEDFGDLEDEARPDGWSDGEDEEDAEGGSDDEAAPPSSSARTAGGVGTASNTTAGGSAEGEDGDSDAGGAAQGEEEEDVEFAIEGSQVLWRYRSQRRRWRARVRCATTLPCVAISAQELHERASAAGLAGVPASLIARDARPWTVQEDDDDEDEEGGQGGANDASSEGDDDGDDIFEEED